MARRLTEHEDLRATRRHLSRFREQPRVLRDELCLLYSARVIDRYREHSDRERLRLFPALEQLACSMPASAGIE